VRFRLTTAAPGRFVDEAFCHGVHLLPSGTDGVRAVFYLDIDRSAVELALVAVAKTLGTL
jgi:threonine aldolase